MSRAPFVCLEGHVLFMQALKSSLRFNSPGSIAKKIHLHSKMFMVSFGSKKFRPLIFYSHNNLPNKLWCMYNVPYIVRKELLAFADGLQ